jgi:hypothetical protein
MVGRRQYVRHIGISLLKGGFKNRIIGIGKHVFRCIDCESVLVKFGRSRCKKPAREPPSFDCDLREYVYSNAPNEDSLLQQ